MMALRELSPRMCGTKINIATNFISMGNVPLKSITVKNQ